NELIISKDYFKNFFIFFVNAGTFFSIRSGRALKTSIALASLSPPRHSLVIRRIHAAGRHG
ncbi:hypothetical protein, partial [Pantoea ananatis]|uniref:hypothetical protein n=1 Tax=Pantoea ananas TaxID=553 RepID=UPI001B304F62